MRKIHGLNLDQFCFLATVRNGWRGDGACGAVGRRLFLARLFTIGWCTSTSALAKRCGARRSSVSAVGDLQIPTDVLQRFQKEAPRPRRTNRTFHGKGLDLSASRNLHPASMALTLVAVPTLSFGGFGVAAPKKGKPVGFAYGARTRPRPLCAPLRPSIPIADARAHAAKASHAHHECARPTQALALTCLRHPSYRPPG